MVKSKMNCLKCNCVERKSSEKTGSSKRIRLISHLCDIQEVDSELKSGQVEVTYIEEPTLTMSTCVNEGTYQSTQGFIYMNVVVLC